MNISLIIVEVAASKAERESDVTDEQIEEPNARAS